MNKSFFILVQVLLGFILADIIAGMFHWFEDTYLDYCIDIPILSEISKDNELHHYFPRSILAYSYIQHMYVSLPIAILVLGIIYAIYPKWVIKYYVFFGTLAFFSISANIFHRVSHMRPCECHPIIKALQTSGILCSHVHHSVHHKTSTEKYCVISEYNNYVLDTIGFWRGLELIIYLCTGIIPTRNLRYDAYIEIQNYMHENAKLECPDLPTLEEVNELELKLKEYKKCVKK